MLEIKNQLHGFVINIESVQDQVLAHIRFQSNIQG